uniref:Myelin protein zero-like 2b n=1 Tax=Astyanax mexicanus TaxID=7994 RepID=A0A8B9R9I4_ASTMX
MFLLSAVGVLVIPGVHHVVAIEVSTTKELTAVNGTSVTLKCTFKSTSPLTESSVSVNWSFRPVGQTKEEPVFYYQQKSYPPMENSRFRGHVTWSGNVLKNDASITLQDVQFSFNGTYSCQVRNVPDVHGFASEISLQVVQSVKSCMKKYNNQLYILYIYIYIVLIDHVYKFCNCNADYCNVILN